MYRNNITEIIIHKLSQKERERESTSHKLRENKYCIIISYDTHYSEISLQYYAVYNPQLVESSQSLSFVQTIDKFTTEGKKAVQ